MDREIVVSVKTVFVAFIFVLIAYILWKLWPILAIFLIAIIIVFSMEPPVESLMRVHFLNKPLSRSVAVLFSYLILIILLIGMFTIALPPILSQAQRLLDSLSNLTEDAFNLSEGVSFSLFDFIPQISQASGNIVSATFSVVSNLATIVTVFVISIYMSLDWENLKKRFFSLFPQPNRDEALETFERIEANVGHWIKGQLFLMLVVGFASFVGLTILGIPYALALGLISGILEIVPILGPVIASILACIVGFSVSPVKGIMVLVLFLIIQQVENNVLVPKVMQRVSGFSPLVIIFALLIGSEFFGVVGAILAVPITMIVVVLVRKFLNIPLAGSE